MSIGQPQSMLLNMFGDLVQEGFGTRNVYHVGSSLKKEKGDSWRDVDVRVLLNQKQWDDQGFIPACEWGVAHLDPKWRALCMVWAHYGRHMTGLPIDFQIQLIEPANEKYSAKNGHPRSWLGTMNDESKSTGIPADA